MRRSRWIALAVLLALTVALLLYAVLETYWLQVREEQWVSPDVPAGWDGKSIVFVTDPHVGIFYSRARLRRLVDQVNAMQPDLILLGGDYVFTDRDYIEPCFAELARLQAPLGKFGVMGNRDHYVGATATYHSMQRAGIRPVDNLGLWIESGGERMRIGGVGDLWEDTQDLAPVLESTRESDLVILLSHNPDFAESIRDQRIDLVLSGHTHGGQVALFGWAPWAPSDYGPKYRTGRVDTGVTTVIISNGIGTAFPPVRLGARPQIVRLTLRSGS
jgi:predicted MPP superfamily phosphohydrolase